MVARLHSQQIQASQSADSESYTDTVGHSFSSQVSVQDESSRLSIRETLSVNTKSPVQPIGETAKPFQAVIKNLSAHRSPDHKGEAAAAVAGSQMPRQRRLFSDDVPASNDAGDDACVSPEPTKAGFSQQLKQLARKSRNFKAIVCFQGDAPVLVCIEKIRQAKLLSGLSDQEIADLIGVKSRHTVAAARRLDPSTNLFTFIAVMNVLGLDIAELFPLRKKKLPNIPTWPRGYHNTTENLQRLVFETTERKRDVRATRRTGRERKQKWG
jgi:transcriptional regulator with XRE-family HTH domain